jgi:DNA-binding protein YbaB
MADDPRAAMDALLDRLVDVLSGAGAIGAGTTSGTAADGGVVVTLTAHGRVESIDVDPRMLRHREAIGPAVVAAFNEALRARPDRRDDAAATRTELTAIQEESVVVTQQLNGSLLTTLERLKGL